MTEFHSLDAEVKESYYRCLLCDKKMDPRQVIPHLICLRHRRRYVVCNVNLIFLVANYLIFIYFILVFSFFPEIYVYRFIYRKGS